MSHLKGAHNRIGEYKKMIDHHFHKTNQSILEKRNPYFSTTKKGTFHIDTPKTGENDHDHGLFPERSLISLGEVLSTVEQLTGYLGAFRHWQPKYKKRRPDKAVFFATIMAFGCNLGVAATARSVLPLTADELDNAAKWYFSLDNINRAIDMVNNFVGQLALSNLYRKDQEQLRTSSDGQKIKVISNDTIYATFSYEHLKKGKGVTAYRFIDERCLPFYSCIIGSTEREAPYVLDGLLHNPNIRSTYHSTDTHGYTEATFGILDILGFGFSPTYCKSI